MQTKKCMQNNMENKRKAHYNNPRLHLKEVKIKNSHSLKFSTAKSEVISYLKNNISFPSGVFFYVYKKVLLGSSPFELFFHRKINSLHFILINVLEEKFFGYCKHSSRKTMKNFHFTE